MRALALLLMCSTAYAGNEVSIGASNRALRSSSADALTGDSLISGQLGVARELHFAIRDVAIWATGAMWWGRAKGTLFNDLSTDLEQGAGLIGGRARYVVVRHLAATAHVQVGVAHTSLALTDSMNRELSDARWGGIAEGAIGLDLFAVDQKRLTLGARLELGYVAATAVTLTGKASHPDDGTLRLPMTQASLGQLDLSGPYAGIAVVSQF
jgi:hypothetical protein